jgi:hypothetical protein
MEAAVFMDREKFLYWWPVVARVLGVVGAFFQGASAIATHQSADAGFLAFCGALVVAPVVFPVSEKKNDQK